MQQHGRNMVEIVQVSLFFIIELFIEKKVDRLLTWICIIPKVNLGVGEMRYMFFDL